jgi:hypothetical protein
MRALSSIVYSALILSVGSAIAACSGVGNTMSSTLDRQTAAIGSRIGSTVARNSASGALLYVSGRSAHIVTMYTYPKLQFVARLAAGRYPMGLCVDPRTQDVWVVSQTNGNEAKLLQFAHGEVTPIRTIKTDSSAETCAVDPVTGNLAVAVTHLSEDPGTLLVYKHSTGRPKSYNLKGLLLYLFVGYDSKGTLYVDGTPAGSSMPVRIGQLSPGDKELRLVRLHTKLFYPGNVQSDGTDLAIGQERRPTIYRINGSRIVGTVALNGACFVQQFYIHGNRVIVPNTCGSQSTINIYAYPSGGNPLRTFNPLFAPFGAAIST